MDELNLTEKRDLRRMAEQLYDQAVENLGIKPTRAERAQAILQIMQESHAELSKAAEENTAGHAETV